MRSHRVPKKAKPSAAILLSSVNAVNPRLALYTRYASGLLAASIIVVKYSSQVVNVQRATTTDGNRYGGC